MRRVLLTGMSGTGKSTLIEEFSALGHRSVDTDRELTSWDPAGAEYLWNEDAITRLLSVDEGELLFVAGCVRNQVEFYPRFDHIVLLTAPVPLTIERLRARTTNPYGKDPAELAEVLAHKESVEPLLRGAATLEVDTSAPLETVKATILEHVRA